MSVALPAVKPTMIRTGFDGRSCARAIRDTDGSTAAPAARCRNCLRWGRFNFAPPSRFTSLDHLIGASEQRRRHLDAERIGGLEVEDRFVLGRRLHGQIGWLLALQDAVDVAGGAPELIDEIGPIRNQAAGVDENTIVVDRGQLVAGRQLDDQVAMKSYPAAASRD